MKGIRVALLMAVLVLVLGGGSIQAQDAIDLSQPGNVKIMFADGSQVWCVTEPLENGWTGGMFIPPADSPFPSVWASCNVTYDLTNVVMVTFSPIADLDLVIELTCNEGLVPEDPELFCRPS